MYTNPVSRNLYSFNANTGNLIKFLIIIPLVFALIFLISPFSNSYGISFIIFAPFFSALYILLVVIKGVVSRFLVFLSLLVVITALFSSLHHADVRFIFFAGNIVIALLVFSLVDRTVFDKIISLTTFFIFILLFGAWITFFHVAMTGMPDAFYVSESGREISRGLFSLGYALWTPAGTFFRAASIYDEPGTFSFVICSIAALRHVLYQNKQVTWLMLILGLVTLSLAHLIYILFHLLAEKGVRVKISVLLGFLLIGLFVYFVHSDALLAFQRVFERFQLSGDNERLIAGDNRTQHLLISVSQLKEADFWGLLFGVSSAFGCCNPVYPLVERGILGSWPYYFLVLFFLFAGIYKRNWIYIAVALLFMQRPSIQSTGYSFFAAALFFSAFLDKRDKKISLQGTSKIRSARS